MIEAVKSRFLPSRSRHSSAECVPVKRKTAEGVRLATRFGGRGTQPTADEKGRSK